MIFKFDIEPVAQGRPRAVRVGNSVRMHDPKKTARFKADLRLMAQAAVRVQHYRPLEGALDVSISVFRPVPTSWSRKKRTEAINGFIFPTTKPDMSNYIKSIEDAFNGVLWHDDNATVDIHGTKRYAETGYLTVEVKQIVAHHGATN
jgi:Holliday junction resolvase RusA-like endonuclease